MAAVAAGDVFQITLVGVLCSQRIMNTFHMQAENIPAGGLDHLAAYALIETHFEKPGGIIQAFLGCCPTNYTLQEMWIQLIGPTKRLVKVIAPQATDGQFVSAAGTANLAAVVTRTTEKAGRSQQSALHIPIGTDADTFVDGDLDADLLVAMDALEAPIIEQLGVVPAFTADPVIYHGPVPFAAPDQIIAVTPRQTVRVMRRRTKGIGI